MSMLARDLLPERHSTPGLPFHADLFMYSDFDIPDVEYPDHVHAGVRLLVTVDCANVTQICSARGRWEYTVQAPCAGAGIGMPIELRGIVENGETEYVHAGGTHFVDGTPLPARLQLLFDFDLLDEPSFNATMDAFRLGDLRDAAKRGELDLQNSEVAAMVAELAEAVRGRE